MTISTLPRMAIDIDATGHVWFPFRTSVDGAILFADQPVLPRPSFEWAVLPDDDRPHVTLDALAVAELLYASEIPLTDTTTDDQLRTAVLTQLERCHCDLRECAGPIGFEYGEYPDLVQPRLAVCAAFAARIVRTEADA